jgi:hypothetical protein
MPNHTSNILKLRGEPRRLEVILGKHFRDEVLSLDSIIPEPPELSENALFQFSWESRQLAEHVEELFHYLQEGLPDTGDRRSSFDAARMAQIAGRLAPQLAGATTFEEALAHLRETGQEEVAAEAKRLRSLRERYGVTWWYEWRIQNWGTKWDCYGGSVSEPLAGKLEANFNTAWSPPTPAILRLSEMYPDVEMTLHSLDEGGGFALTQEFLGGQVVGTEEHEWSSFAVVMFGIPVEYDEYDAYDAYWEDREAEEAEEAEEGEEDEEDEEDEETPPTSGLRGLRLL